MTTTRYGFCKSYVENWVGSVTELFAFKSLSGTSYLAFWGSYRMLIFEDKLNSGNDILLDNTQIIKLVPFLGPGAQRIWFCEYHSSFIVYRSSGVTQFYEFDETTKEVNLVSSHPIGEIIQLFCFDDSRDVIINVRLKMCLYKSLADVQKPVFINEIEPSQQHHTTRYAYHWDDNSFFLINKEFDFIMVTLNMKYF